MVVFDSAIGEAHLTPSIMISTTPASRLTPVIVMFVPPLIGPKFGTIEETYGVVSESYWTV